MPARAASTASRSPGDERRSMGWTPPGLRSSRAATGAGRPPSLGDGFVDGHGSAERPTIYLDVDGVVTTVDYQRHAGRDRLNPAQIARVAALVREFGAQVVVSSTWRVADCRPTLVEAGLPADCFHADWRTAILPASRNAETGEMLPAERARRGDEIAEHARRNGITKYLILDDVEVGPAHAGRHVQPDATCGFREADGVLARQLLSCARAA